MIRIGYQKMNGFVVGIPPLFVAWLTLYFLYMVNLQNIGMGFPSMFENWKLWFAGLVIAPVICLGSGIIYHNKMVYNPLMKYVGLGDDDGEGAP